MWQIAMDHPLLFAGLWVAPAYKWPFPQKVGMQVALCKISGVTKAEDAGTLPFPFFVINVNTFISCSEGEKKKKKRITHHAVVQSAP